MQNVKKYFTEGLIQLTILLSLIGVRVDVDSYLNGYYSPLLEINLGPSSAYTQTPFHSLRDTLDGYSVHPKCPELDYFFASRRLLDEVRTLGSPRFPTQLDAWLVHQVPDTDSSSEPGEPSHNAGTDISSGSESTGDDGHHDGEHLPDSGQEECQASLHLDGTGPCSTGACGLLKEEQDDAIHFDGGASSLTQLAHSSTLEQETLQDSNAGLSDTLGSPAPTIDINQHWNHFLSLPVAEFGDLDPLVPERLPNLDSDITSAISQDVSLQDAMVAGAYGAASQRGGARPIAPAPLFRLESTNSSHSDLLPGMMSGSAAAALPFASVCSGARDIASQDGLGGCLDEAVFDQINLMGLEGLGTIDASLLEGLDSLDPRFLEDLDSDSGLSLESSSRGPTSPGTSDMSSSSSSSSLCDEECGATGYSGDVDRFPPKGVARYASSWPPVDPSESVWHDHSYSSPSFLHSPAVPTFPHKAIKEEPLSDDEEEFRGADDHEPSRDELRARAMCIPFSAPQIVNMPVEEFLEALEGHSFSPEQVTLLRDIRRRGKNKLAAQNCRKRKLDAITGLQEEVARLQAQRDRLLREKQQAAKTVGAVGQQIGHLTRDILARLRDASGQPLSPDRYTLQCGANGRVVVQPVRRSSASTTQASKTDKRKKDKKQ